MRQLWKLIRPIAGRWKLWGGLFLGIFSGLCNFLFIGLVTRVVGLLMAGQITAVSREYLLIFALVILVFIWTRRSLSLLIIELSQRLFWSLRKHILSLTLSASYHQLSRRRVKVYSAIVNDVGILTQTSLSIIDFFSSLIMAVSCLFYLASISLVLLLITLGVAAVGMLVYHYSSKKNRQQFEKARQLENTFMRHFNSILDGFKEIYMEPRKGRVIYDRHITNIANEAYRNNRTAFIGYLNNQVTGRVLFYMLITAILLYFSVTLKIKTSDLVSYVFTLLYLLGSIEMIMSLLPGIVRARVSAAHLADLQAELTAAGFDNTVSPVAIPASAFQRITVHDLTFEYPGEGSTFGIGPVNLTIQRGEVVFIYGGNGSGKTTFVHALLGLSTPASGEIRLNGVPVGKHNYSEYKTIFAVVFSDFYLFDEILGIDEPDRDKCAYYLRLFELEEKVRLEKNRFTTTELSAGQRKRLALVAALLEERPVLVLDEWAADQDPYFRMKFYTEIIPRLKEEGITVLAVTHDDKYYGCADSLYKMDSGKLSKQSKEPAAVGAFYVLPENQL